MTRQINNKLSHSTMAGHDITQNYYLQKSTGCRLLNKVPKPDTDYVVRKSEEEKITNAIKGNNIIQIYGISGSGKTELVKKVVSQIKDFNCFWVSCEKAEEISLYSVYNMLGQNFNLLSKIDGTKSLIVLDNVFSGINNVISEFLCAKTCNSKLIIISQEKIFNSAISEKILIDFMSKEEAQQIFTDSKFQDNEFMSLFKKLEYHPMTLKLIKTYLLEEDNGLDVTDFLNTGRLVELRDSELTNSQEICKKILGDYFCQKKEVCMLLSKLDSNRVEAGFLKQCIFSEVVELTKRGFLKLEDGYYSIHDIILNSMKALVKEKPQVVQLVYEKEIMDYLNKENENRTLGFYTFFALHQNFLKDVFQTCANSQMKILIYNSLLLFSNQKDKEIHITNINKLLKNDDLTSYYSIKLLIEKLELWVHSGKKEEKKDRNKQAVKELQDLLERDIDSNCKLLITFHIGKFYNWNYVYKKAEEVFVKVLSINPNESPAQLQLLRIYRYYIVENRKNCGDVKKEEELQKKVSNILNQIVYEKIPVAIYLEIVNLVKNQPLNSDENLNTCLWKPFGYFKKVVTLYAETNIFEHIYGIVGELSDALAYQEPAFFIEWFNKVGHPVDNNKMRKAVIQIYASAIKIFGKNGEDYSNYIQILERCWQDWKTEKVTAFNYNIVIKMYISVGIYDKAEKELKEIYNENNEWHLKFMAQIHQGSGALEEALDDITKAIGIYDKNVKSDGKYKFAFLRDKAEILHNMGNNDCIDVLKQAIKEVTDKELKKEWEKVLESWIHDR